MGTACACESGLTIVLMVTTSGMTNIAVAIECHRCCKDWYVRVLESQERPKIPMGQEQEQPYRPKEQPKGMNQGRS